jgi:hypothetical protein
MARRYDRLRTAHVDGKTYRFDFSTAHVRLYLGREIAVWDVNGTAAVDYVFNTRLKAWELAQAAALLAARICQGRKPIVFRDELDDTVPVGTDVYRLTPEPGPKPGSEESWYCATDARRLHLPARGRIGLIRQAMTAVSTAWMFARFEAEQSPAAVPPAPEPSTLPALGTVTINGQKFRMTLSDQPLYDDQGRSCVVLIGDDEITVDSSCTMSRVLKAVAEALRMVHDDTSHDEDDSQVEREWQAAKRDAAEASKELARDIVAGWLMRLDQPERLPEDENASYADDFEAFARKVMGTDGEKGEVAA